MYTTYLHGEYKVTLADDKQVKYFNPHAIGTVRPLPVQNKRSLLKLYINTQYVPKPSFTEEINLKATCGNRIFLKAKHERKQSCRLTPNNLLSKSNIPSAGSGNEKKENGNMFSLRRDSTFALQMRHIDIYIYFISTLPSCFYPVNVLQLYGRSLATLFLV